MKWEDGRQNSGYKRHTFFRVMRPFPCDCHLIKFPTDSEIPPHIDEVENGKHFRLNIILKKARKGGEFVCENMIIDWSRIKLFRPDEEEHSVTKIEEGNRLVFSIGWLL